MRYLFVAAIILVLPLQQGRGQVNKAAAGLVFASGLDFNQGETGNPGLVLKTWIDLDKKSRLQLAPSITAFNRYRNLDNTSIYQLATWMLMADLDLQYAIYKSFEMNVVAFAGGNFTYLLSNVKVSDPAYASLPGIPQGDRGFAPGANLGAVLELRMAKQWDGNLMAKYILAQKDYRQFIISVQAVYYFASRRRSYYR